LFGEAGGLLSEAKKKQRDEAAYLGYAEGVTEELGDVLWYLAAVVRRAGLALSDVGAVALGRAYERGSNESLSFHDLIPTQKRLRKSPIPAFAKTLLALAGDIGTLVNEYESGALAKLPAQLAIRLASVLAHLMRAADESGVSLEAAAVKNLHKIEDRWPTKRIYPDAFDADEDPEEQLPRRMVIDVYEREVRAQTYVFQRSEGVYVGDRLTDNAREPDDYRFHDVFHYAYVAVLGWSPVIRSLLRLKRKSDPKVDEAEDGARAILIEEGITTWIFGQAQQLRLFEGFQRDGLPLDLLKHVREFVAGYEVERCPLWLWEEAILQGYAAFRFLKDRRRGRVTIDFRNRRLGIKDIPA
jgi:NTP pyrophosphatase (non-canonical NTP hydrolase)